MDPTAQLRSLIRVAGDIGIQVRRARLGGDGGGLCTIRGRRVLFLDRDADAATQLARTARALASLSETEVLFLRPDLRELLDRFARDE